MAFTFFFRDYTVLETAVDLLVTETIGRSRVRIWDAGCAMGPEPYTLLICLAEKMGRFAFENIRLDATDYDEGGNFEQIIMQGHYPIEQVKRIPSGFLTKYFTRIDHSAQEEYQIDLKLRNKLSFRKHNLLSLNPIGEGYAMIVCKNVLLHFTEEQRIKVLTMFNNALAPGGLLVMEHTQKVPDTLRNVFIEATSDAPIYKKTEVKSIAA